MFQGVAYMVTLQTYQPFEVDRRVPGNQASERLCDVSKWYIHTSKQYARAQNVSIHLRIQQGSESAITCQVPHEVRWSLPLHLKTGRTQTPMSASGTSLQELT